MTAVAPVVAVALLPLVLTALRRWPTLVVATALAACLVPFSITGSPSLLRAAVALVTWVLLLKSVQYFRREQRPQGAVDMLVFFASVSVVRWDAPRRAQPARAARAFATGVAQLAATGALVLLVRRLDLRNPAEIVTTELGIYVTLAGLLNLATVPLALRGLDYDDPFDHPLAARTPSEFWGRRWNTWVNDVLYHRVFRPSGGRRRPARGTMAAFAVSGLLHEAIVIVSDRFRGGMLAFFLLQSLVVVATSRSRGFRRFAGRHPLAAWALTLVTMTTTGALLVQGMATIDPSQAWHRCCAGGSSPGTSRPPGITPDAGRGEFLTLPGPGPQEIVVRDGTPTEKDAR